MGGAAGVSLYVFAVFALGVLLPGYLRLNFLGPEVLLAYSSLSVLFVPSVMAESFAGDAQWKETVANSGKQRRAWFYAKLAAGTLYGWISGIVILARGILTVNTAAAGSIRPPAWVAFDLVLRSFAIAAFTACGSTAIAVGARNPKGAKRTLRHAFLLLLVIAIYVWRQ